LVEPNAHSAEGLWSISTRTNNTFYWHIEALIQETITQPKLFIRSIFPL